MRLPSCWDTAGAVGSRTVVGPPGRWGTATPLACAPRTLLLMGEDSASNRRGLMGTDEGKVAIDAEIPTRPGPAWQTPTSGMP